MQFDFSNRISECRVSKPYKYKIYLYELSKQKEKRAFGKYILYLLTMYVYCVYPAMS